MSAVPWLHCNKCMTPASSCAANLLFTACGTVVCSNCLAGMTSNCSACRGPCRTVRLDKRAPAEVLRLFKDPDDLIKDIYKILEFQDSQKAKFISFHNKQKDNRFSLITEAENKKAREEAVLSQLKTDLENLEVEERERKATLGKEIERRRESRWDSRSGKKNSDKFLISRRDGSTDPSDSLNGRGPGRPRPFVDCFGGVGNSSLDSVVRCGNRGGLNTTSRSDGVMSGVFELQMKTPGRWLERRNAEQFPINTGGQIEGRGFKNPAKVLGNFSAGRKFGRITSPLTF